MQKILIIRFSSIGDIVLTTPVIRCLKKQLGAEVHFLTKRQYLSLLEANPYLDKIFTIDKKVKEVLPLLKREGYDYIIDLHKNIRSWQVRLGLRKKTYSFQKLNFQKWLLVQFKINRLPNVHIVDRYLKSVESLGVKNDNDGLDYFFPVNCRPPSAPEVNSGQAVHRPPFVTFAIGAAHRTKRLSVEKAISICKKIKLPVLLLGGKEEGKEGEQIAKVAGEHVSNYCGKLTLHESAYVIKHAQKVITHDTGMMHIAAAFQKEIIVAWGNTVPALGMYPYFGKNGKGNFRSFEMRLPCRPCSKIGYKKCPKGHFKCMQLQDSEAIAKAAIEVTHY